MVLPRAKGTAYLNLSPLEELGILTPLPTHVNTMSAPILMAGAISEMTRAARRIKRESRGQGVREGEAVAYAPLRRPFFTAFLFRSPRNTMGPRRYLNPPDVHYSPRTLLDGDKRPRIDAALKQLRTCTRRLQTMLSMHRDEIQILERLYYKGKNQHRTALFWQRVEEMRRYGDRLDGMGMYDLLESLRLSFWGPPSQRK